MAVCFEQGSTLTRGDLDIFLTNTVGNPTNVYAITYAIYYVDPGTDLEVLVGASARTPVNPAVGEYYAAIQIPATASAGTYRIRWDIQELSSSPVQQVVQEFCVTVAVSTSPPSPYSPCVTDMISKLRFMLRDRHPDRNYRFRPPEGEGVVGCYNQVFGYIWEDDELYQFLEMALWKWNTFPPETEELSTLDKLCSGKPVWRVAVLWGALVLAAQALAYNWTADEFDYSIGGISLNIDKSSKYMALKENAEEQFLKLTEAKLTATKLFGGLQQPRFGRGVRSAFGPAVGRGVLSPRGFLVWCISAFGADFIAHALNVLGGSGIV